MSESDAPHLKGACVLVIPGVDAYLGELEKACERRAPGPGAHQCGDGPQEQPRACRTLGEPV